jgi:hypothetical protein
MLLQNEQGMSLLCHIYKLLCHYSNSSNDFAKIDDVSRQFNLFQKGLVAKLEEQLRANKEATSETNVLFQDVLQKISDMNTLKQENS